MANRSSSSSGDLPALRELREGQRGEGVRELQRLLNQRGAALATDAIFGPKTAAAVRRVQREALVAVTGIVDAATWTALLR